MILVKKHFNFFYFTKKWCGACGASNFFSKNRAERAEHPIFSFIFIIYFRLRREQTTTHPSAASAAASVAAAAARRSIYARAADVIIGVVP